ncbi:hypothetical protein FRC12_011034 [Ceratobasidium sp. 428]|nr:hypothetical protein FRC12_011034 [Ceratobasidium sp. 428]
MSTFSSPSFRYISPTELSELIKSDKKPMKDYAVVDVRDDDFIGGNIVGCVRAPSNNYLTTVDGLVTKTKDVPKMIFHCALSQIRQVIGAQSNRKIFTPICRVEDLRPLGYTQKLEIIGLMPGKRPRRRYMFFAEGSLSSKPYLRTTLFWWRSGGKRSGKRTS